MEVLECLVGFVQASLLAPPPPLLPSSDDDQPAQRESAAIRRIARLAGVNASCDDAVHVLAAVQAWLEPCLASLPPTFFQPVVSESTLSPSQAAALQNIDSQLSKDYSQRRAALLARTRLALQAMAAAPRVGEEDSTGRVEAMAAQLSQWCSVPQVSMEQLFTLTHGAFMKYVFAFCIAWLPRTVPVAGPFAAPGEAGANKFCAACSDCRRAGSWWAWRRTQGRCPQGCVRLGLSDVDTPKLFFVITVDASAKRVAT